MIRINLSLTEKEAESVQTIYDKLVDIDLFKDISKESYDVLDRLIKAVNDELKLEELKNRVGFEFGEKCQTCGHSSKAHGSNGIGLCCSESCNCFLMVRSGKPY